MRKLLILALSCLPALAAAGPEIVASVTIRPGWREGNRQYAALEITMAPGWHTYWRVPGEAGIPPVLDLNLSSNVVGYDIVWPVPQVFDLNGMLSFGYEDHVILPLIVELGDAGAVAELQGEVSIGVCRDVCTPFQTELRQELPVVGARDPAIKAAIERRARHGAVQVTCAAEALADGLRLTATLAAGKAEHVVVELPGSDVWISDAGIQRSGGQMTLSVDMVPPEAAPFALDRSRLRFTLLSPGMAVEISGCTG